MNTTPQTIRYNKQGVVAQFFRVFSLSMSLETTGLPPKAATYNHRAMVSSYCSNAENWLVSLWCGT